MIRDRIRIYSKYVTNRLLFRFTNSSRGPFALLHHTGRRSKKSYETVIMVWPMREGFVIALTYGSKVDWYRNMQANEGGSVFWHRRLYEIGKPEPIDAQTALTAFPAFFRLLFRIVGRQMEFVQMKSSGSKPVST